MRRTASFLVSVARIASFKSESTRSCKIMRGDYASDIRLSMLCARRSMGSATPSFIGPKTKSAGDLSSTFSANIIKLERGVNAGANTGRPLGEAQAKPKREPLSFCRRAGEFERDKISVYGLGAEQKQCR